MSEVAPPSGFEDDDSPSFDPAQAELRRRTYFTSIANNPSSGRASEIVSPDRAAALWQTLEDSGITLNPTRPPTKDD